METAPYRTPLGGFETWEAAATACERADFDPCACIEIILPAAGVAAVEPEPVAVLRVGEVQAGALELYVLDPIFDEPLDENDQQPFPGCMVGRELRVFDAAAAWRCLTDAANSADADGDVQMRDALTTLARRVAEIAFN